MLYRSSLPEVNGSIEESGEQSAGRVSSKFTIFRIRIIVAFVIIVATVAVGEGIGIWHTGRTRSATISAQPLKTTFVTTPVSSASPSISSAPRSQIATRATNATNTASPFLAPSTPPSTAPATSLISTASIPPPAYAPGTCHFHLQEWQNCEHVDLSEQEDSRQKEPDLLATGRRGGREQDAKDEVKFDLGAKGRK